jgi:ATP-dependent exoDNAse (exonuclease V), alpha subunit - helicase superfamily I member
MRVTLTVNVNKDIGFVNGKQGVVKDVRGPTIVVEISGGRELVVFPYTEPWVDGVRGRTFYPLRAGYAVTLTKIQGATLEHVTVWLDRPNTRAAGYVAISRVEYMSQVRFLGQLTRNHFIPTFG